MVLPLSRTKNTFTLYQIILRSRNKRERDPFPLVSVCREDVVKFLRSDGRRSVSWSHSRPHASLPLPIAHALASLASLPIVYTPILRCRTLQLSLRWRHSKSLRLRTSVEVPHSSREDEELRRSLEGSFFAGWPSHPSLSIETVDFRRVSVGQLMVNMYCLS